MQTINLGKGRFKYSLIQNEIDVTQLPLRDNLFGLNNRIYADLGSYNMSDETIKEYSKHFTPEELKFPLLVRLFEIHVECRQHNDEYVTKESIDFKPLFDFIESDYEKFQSVYAHFNDSGSKTEKENGVLLLPLNSKILKDACNYAYQEIEKIKVDNMFMTFNPKPLQNFINIF